MTAVSNLMWKKTTTIFWLTCLVDHECVSLSWLASLATSRAYESWKDLYLCSHSSIPYVVWNLDQNYEGHYLFLGSSRHQDFPESWIFDWYLVVFAGMIIWQNMDICWMFSVFKSTCELASSIVYCKFKPEKTCLFLKHVRHTFVFVLTQCSIMEIDTACLRQKRKNTAVLHIASWWRTWFRDSNWSNFLGDFFFSLDPPKVDHLSHWKARFS